MAETIVFHSTHCPKCRILKLKLDMAKINYVENNDMEEMISKGFTTSPMLEVNTKILNYNEAITWITEKESFIEDK